jgi:nucleoside-diphosphate-sugar epimerase
MLAPAKIHQPTHASKKMIFGNGLLASAFAPHFLHDPKVTVFASGVSNSREHRAEQFDRERQLLRATLSSEQLILYFSTCSFSDPELALSPYVQHKAEMERLLQAEAPKWAIFRLPQVVGTCANPHTLTNYLHRQISTGQRFQVWRHARRNLIDVSDVATIATHLVGQQQAQGRVTNIACPFSVPILEVVEVFESVLGKGAHYDLIEAGADYPIDTRQAEITAAEAGVVFDGDYVNRLIKKYYD